MLTETEKRVLNDFADSILQLYHISLIPAEPEFQILESWSDPIDFGVLYHPVPTRNVRVCRCGHQAIIQIPCHVRQYHGINTPEDIEIRTSHLKNLAYGMAILFLRMGYHGDPEKFKSFPNMAWQDDRIGDTETLLFLRDAIFIPEKVLRQYVRKHITKDCRISMKDLAGELGLSGSFVRYRLRSIGIIPADF